MNCDLLRWAAEQDDLPPHLQGILIRLTKRMDHTGALSLPQAELAPLIRLGVTQTRAAIKALVAEGVIIRKRRGSVGKGRASDLLIANFARQHGNADASSLSPDNTDAPTPPSLSEKSHNTDNTEASVLSRRRSAGLAALSSVDNLQRPCISTGARAETLNLNTRDDQIISDQIVPPSKEIITALVKRAGDACNSTSAGVQHAGDLTRFLRAGCTWEDIEFATDKLAANFRERRKRFSTWGLLEEHVLEIRNRRVAGLPPPAPPVAFVRRPSSNGGYGANGIRPMVATA